MRRTFSRRTQHTALSRQQRKRRRLSFEALEERRLLACTVTPNAGVLQVDGTAGSDNILLQTDGAMPANWI